VVSADALLLLLRPSDHPSALDRAAASMLRIGTDGDTLDIRPGPCCCIRLQVSCQPRVFPWREWLAHAAMLDDQWLIHAAILNVGFTGAAGYAYLL
jgi:hypothetical protein